VSKSILRAHVVVLSAVLGTGLVGCDSPTSPTAEKPVVAEPAVQPSAPPAATPASAAVTRVWKDDFDGMRNRRLVRILVVYSKTFYFIDKATQRGSTYEFGMLLEKALNAGNKDRTRPIRVVFIPTSRDQLLPALAGRGDIAAAITITPGAVACRLQHAARR
jgi:hypothetical protein